MKTILVLLILTFRINTFSQNKKSISVVKKTADSTQNKEFLKDKNRSVSLAINEIINGVIATRYIYQVNRQQSFGVHLSVFIFDLSNNSNQYENYKGFKLSTFYQYYLVNNQKAGIYLEPKLRIGYFDAKDI